VRSRSGLDDHVRATGRPRRPQRGRMIMNPIHAARRPLSTLSEGHVLSRTSAEEMASRDDDQRVVSADAKQSASAHAHEEQQVTDSQRKLASRLLAELGYSDTNWKGHQVPGSNQVGACACRALTTVGYHPSVWLSELQSMERDGDLKPFMKAVQRREKQASERHMRRWQENNVGWTVEESSQSGRFFFRNVASGAVQWHEPSTEEMVVASSAKSSAGALKIPALATRCALTIQSESWLSEQVSVTASEGAANQEANQCSDRFLPSARAAAVEEEV
jgi:hypothetical protein